MITVVLRRTGQEAVSACSRRRLSSTGSTARLPVAKLARRYALWITLSLLGFAVIIGYLTATKVRPTLVSTSLFDKLAYYRAHKQNFDLLLVGDSLTYAGLHPEFIDPALGTNSINLARFAHWFATQYPFFQDLVPEIPRGTRVLWSVHLYDFDDGLSVQRVYPVGLANAIRYWSWGAHNPGLADNVLYYNPLTRFFMQRDELRSRVIARGDNPVSVPSLISPALAGDFPAAPTFLDQRMWAATANMKARLTEYYSRLPFVAGVDFVTDGGQVNSVVLYLKRGGYYRIELMPEYFLSRQKRGTPPGVWDTSSAPESLMMFEAGLSAFKRAGVPVTVNVMEEAPWTFVNETVRERNRAALDNALRPIVASYGDDYVHADYRSITNSDYFDYNHFNSNGIAKYTPLLIRELRKLPDFAHSDDR